MRVLIVLVACVCACVASERRYFPEDDHRYDNQRFVLVPDDNGFPRLVDLQHRDVDFELVPEDITVYFHSAAEPTIGHKFSAHDFDGQVNHPDFDPTRKTVFVTHGWTGFNTSYSCRTIYTALLVKDEVNVFVVDWNRPAHEFYTVARQVVPDIGRVLGGFIDKLLETNNMDSSLIMLVGNSLGAHVIGATGAAMKNKPGIIMGLDPAHPLFYLDEPSKRLDISDAKVVHILHTNAGFLGYLSSLGHADYWANGGGQRQPGCGVDPFGYCAHTRSVELFAESINSRAFRSLKCDSYEEFKNGGCDNNQVSIYGGINIDFDATGDFYYETNAESPYAQN
ncbi:phospholipase A1-like [Atheta coriaria]|uniref:phospholipase A1-like n=1 Tax=Dalotia coriaria TaxID=877792 RepID=UPI0031F463A9